MAFVAEGGKRRLRRLLVLVGLSLPLFGGFAAATQSQDNADLSFGFGAGMQVIDPAGAHAAPIWLPDGDVTVDYSLFALSDAELAARYRSGWCEPILHDVTGLLATASRRQRHQPIDGADPFTSQRVDFPVGVPSGFYVLQAATGEKYATSLVNASEAGPAAACRRASAQGRALAHGRTAQCRLEQHPGHCFFRAGVARLSEVERCTGIGLWIPRRTQQRDRPNRPRYPLRPSPPRFRPW